MKQFIATLLLLTFVLTSAVGCGSANSTVKTTNNAGNSKNEKNSDISSDLKTIRLGVLSASSLAWFAQIGDEQGIYKKHGLNVVTSEFAAGIDSVDQLVSGQLDVGFVADFAGINRIGATSDKTDLRFFSSFSKSGAWTLYVNPDEIKTLSDLKGKGVIVSLGTFIEYLNGRTFEKAGITKDDVELLPIEAPTDVIALAKSGAASAFWTTGETAKKLADDYGWVPFATQADIGVNTNTMYMANNDYITNNNDTIKSFIEANDEIFEYVKNNKDEAVKFIASKNNAEESYISLSIDSATYSTTLDKEVYDGLDEVNAWCFKNGFYKNKFNLADFINTDALAEIDPNKASWK